MTCGLTTEDFRHMEEISWPADKIRNKRFLITGANGLIASALVDAMMISWADQHECSVTVLCRNKEKAENRFASYIGHPCFSAVFQDVCEPIPSGLQFDYIIHAASLSHPMAFSQYPVDVIRANFLGALNLLEVAKQNRAKLLYVSSGEVYGSNPENMPAMPETYTGNVNSMLSRSCYPEGKRAAETLCVSHKQQYGTDVVIVRPCYIYGAGITEDNSRADAQFLRNVLKGEDIVMKSDGAQKRTYCYVADCATALLYVLLCGESGEAYNIANKDSIVTIREYAQILADIGGVTLRFELPSDIESAGYSKSQNSVLDATKLEALGWRAQDTIESGLRKTLDILKSL